MSGRDVSAVDWTLPVAPAHAYRALLDEEAVRHWLAPHAYRVYDLVVEARVGGGYRAMIGTDEKKSAICGNYLSLEPARHVRLSWCWPQLDPDDVSHVDIWLEGCEAGTRVRLEHEGHHSEDQRQSRIRAWTSCLTKLEAWIDATGRGAPD